MKISFSEPRQVKGGAVVVLAGEGGKLLANGGALDAALGGAIARAVKAVVFKAGKGSWLELPAPGAGINRVLVAGLGKPSEVKALAVEAVGGGAVGKLATSGEKALVILAEDLRHSALDAKEVAVRIGYGARLGGYRFDKYRTKQKPTDKPTLARVVIAAKGAAAARRAFAPLDAVADGVFLTRDLVSEPANVLYPESFAAQCRKLRNHGLEVEVLGEARMEKLAMGALLGVGQGSERASRLVVMRWNGGPRRAKPVAFIGKGVCFDTGGISIKPAGGMEQMKWDMGGAGTVTGLMRALAGRKAKLNAVGVIGLVENMPSGTAQRPGDVVTSMSGQTIEVINTDAEGRLVLADVLWYVKERFKPRFMVDLATLTGAMITALGHEYAGLFGNDDELAERLTAAGKAEGEGIWRLPLGEAYDKQINSDIADMMNVGGRSAGSITAAQFLQRFVGDVPWAHLDIAGVAWAKSGKPTVPKGGTGWGVRALDRLVRDNYEAK